MKLFTPTSGPKQASYLKSLNRCSPKKTNTAFIRNLQCQAYSGMWNLTVHEAGVRKLLKGLNPTMASDPEAVSCLSSRILLASWPQSSLPSIISPTQWTDANVPSICKNENFCTESNHRSFFLTGVLSKLMEHILYKYIVDHLESYDTLTPLQHGFRRAHSCESQLLLTLDDLMQTQNAKVHANVNVIFSRILNSPEQCWTWCH